MGQKIVATCALDSCDVNGGLIFLGDAFDIVSLLVKGQKVHDAYHRGCNPMADHSKDAA